MKNRFLLTIAAAGLCILGTAAPSSAQLGSGGGVPAQYTIKAINLSIPSTPEFSTVGGETQSKRYTLGKWLEMEVEFSATARSPEVDFKYFVVIANQMLTGEETLVDVPAGQSLFTVMFIPPRTLTTLLKGQPLTSSSVVNIAVQILRPGVNAPAAIKLLKEGPPFYNTLTQVPGLVLTKPNTPFAFLWWDRYEQVKPATPR